MFYLRRALQKTALDVRGPLVISSVQPTHAGGATKAKPVAFPAAPQRRRGPLPQSFTGGNAA